MRQRGAAVMDAQEEVWAQDWRRDGAILARGLLSAEGLARLTALGRAAAERSLIHDPHLGRARERGDVMVRKPHHPAYATALPGGSREALDAVADPAALRLARAAFGSEPLLRSVALAWEDGDGARDSGWVRDGQLLAADEADERRIIAERGGHAMHLRIALGPCDLLEYVPGSNRRWDSPEEWRVRYGDGRAHVRGEMPGARRVALAPGDAMAIDPLCLQRNRSGPGQPWRLWYLTLTEDGYQRHDCFSDQPWLLEPGSLDGLSPQAAAFFARFVAAHREHWPASGPG
jgi:hypothetical protein